MLLAPAIHPSTCASSFGVASCMSEASRRPKTTLINGRLFSKHSLLPVDVGFCNEDRRAASASKRCSKRHLALCWFRPLIDIVADYSESRSRQFAEELYAELWEGRTDLLREELYDLEMDVLKEPHHFWDYLSGGAQPVVAFVHMLWEARKKHPGLGEDAEELCKAGFCKGAADSILCSGLS